MKKLIIFIFLTTAVKINTQRLYGEDLGDASVVLMNALEQISRLGGGPSLKLKGIESAYKFIPHTVYTFDAQLLDPEGNLGFCIVEISLAKLHARNSLVVISCGGEEKLRHVLKGSLDVD